MLVAIVWFCSDRGISAGLVAWPLLVVTVLLGTLMVSRVRYRSFKAGLRSGRVPFAWIFLLLVLLVLLAIDLPARSEEHTSELQSRGHLVCRLLLEKKKYNLRRAEPAAS